MPSGGSDTQPSTATRGFDGLIRHAPAPARKGCHPLDECLVRCMHDHDIPGVIHLVHAWIEALKEKTVTISPRDVQTYEVFCRRAFNRWLYTHAYDSPWVSGDIAFLCLSDLTILPPYNIAGISPPVFSLAFPVPLQLVFDLCLSRFKSFLAGHPSMTRSQAAAFFPFPSDIAKIEWLRPWFMRYDKQAGALVDSWLRERAAGNGRSMVFDKSYCPPASVTGVSIIVPVFNKADLTKQFLDSFVQAQPEHIPFELIVADNASTDGTSSLLSAAQREYSWLSVVTQKENAGYGGACNAGASRARHSHLLFLNNDMLFFRHWIEPLCSAFGDGRVGVAGGRLVYPSFTVQHAGIVFQENRLPVHKARNLPFSCDDAAGAKEFGAVTGACLMVPKILFDRLRGFDPAFRMYYEDIDLCLRIHASGKKIVYVPDTTLIHLEAKSSNSMIDATRKNAESMPRYLEKWGYFLTRALKNDPELFRAGIPYSAHPTASPHQVNTPSADQAALRDLIANLYYNIKVNAIIPAFDLLLRNKRIVNLFENDASLKTVLALLQQKHRESSGAPYSATHDAQAGGTGAPLFSETARVVVGAGSTHTASLRTGSKKLKVLFQNRSNMFEHPGGDTVVAKKLKAQLEQRNVEVDISSDEDLESIGSYDLVHLFNLTLPFIIEPYAKNAVAHNVPFVVTTLQEDFPLYYHKAVSSFSWFRDYVTADRELRATLPALAAVYAEAQPVPLVTSSYTARAANRLLACGETEAALLARSFPSARISVVPFGSSPSAIDAPAALFEERFNIRDFVLCVARVEVRKNQLMLLKALEEVDLPLVFADGGFAYLPEYVSLCKIFKRKGRAVFTGRLSDDLLVSAYRACKVHCLPSWYELPGLVTLEACRYGCATAASSWGSLPDYLGDACHYCSPDDPSSIREAVLSAYDSGSKIASSERARQFTWEKNGERTLQVYDQVLQEHRCFAPEFVAEAQKNLALLTVPRFMNQVVKFVENGKVREALRFYNEHRKTFSDEVPELVQMDVLLAKLQKTGVQ
jgi:GT2 family glycosyltransferase/glycosyltransferase involved in cell wall biosynthesis